MGTVHRLAGRPDLAVAASARAATLAEQGALLHLPATRVALASVWLYCSDAPQAQAEAEHALELARRASRRIDECRRSPF